MADEKKMAINNMNGVSEDADKSCGITDMNCVGDEATAASITDMNGEAGGDKSCGVTNMNCL